jgi:hypothetical protein
MNFSFQRHIRTAGAVVVIVGAICTNLPLMIVGNIIMAMGYILAITKLEIYVEEQSEKEDKDAIH